MLEFRDSIPGHVDQILAMEAGDQHFICSYSRQRHLECMASEEERHLSIFREGSELPVGFIILRQINNPHRALEFRRIVIADKGKGYGRQALQWIKHYCFEELGFHRLWFDVFTFNRRAIHLYESEGFIREGTLRDALLVAGHYRSLHLYSMLSEDYRHGTLES